MSSPSPETVRFRKADVRKEGDWKGIVEAARGAFGRVDCLVNNAGATYRNKVGWLGGGCGFFVLLDFCFCCFCRFFFGAFVCKCAGSNHPANVDGWTMNGGSRR